MSPRNTSFEGRQPGFFAVDSSTRRVNNNVLYVDGKRPEAERLAPFPSGK
jgi:hypothetical protein